MFTIGRFYPLLFFADETPQFVALHVADFNLTNPFRHDCFALFAGLHQQLENRGDMNVQQPRYAGYAVALQEHSENHFRLLDGQVHAV
jgi:hypothetical protein